MRDNVVLKTDGSVMAMLRLNGAPSPWRTTPAATAGTASATPCCGTSRTTP
ncbi:hypothetical protein ACFQU7_35440 [Pseudoroseomonas wenyumeiae]